MLDLTSFECEVCFPSLQKARKHVPPEYLLGWSWFQQNEGTLIPRLPMGTATPEGMPFPLARQSGIHTPSDKRLTLNDGYRKHALSVHSNDEKRYQDRHPVQLGNGTWILDYAAQDNATGKVDGQGYNDALFNCLNDGVPIGVMVKEGTAWRVWGLAYVEKYNSTSRMFTLHGPVNAVTEAAHRFDIVDRYSFDADQLSVPIQDEEDEETRKYVMRLQRIRQDQFRTSLLAAYGGRCAVSGNDVPEVLQAAHIEPYRGRISQRAANGILLRSDLHLLYDAHLMTVEPDTHRIHISSELAHSEYLRLAGTQMAIPRDRKARPNEDLLAHHFELVQSEQDLIA